MNLEDQARLAWKAWGDSYQLMTACSCCGLFRYCCGKRRSRMLCLVCWDGGAR